jgi:5'-nucleotidase
VSDPGPSLIVGVTTRALFDLEFENEIFETEGLGLAAFRAYQREHEKDPIAPGTAFPLVRDLLALGSESWRVAVRNRRRAAGRRRGPRPASRHAPLGRADAFLVSRRS